MLDVNEVKSAARGNWARILNSVAGIGDDCLTTTEGPCPVCIGTSRFNTYKDFAETGGCICNQCGKMPDGLAVIMWKMKVSFRDALTLVAEHLGIKSSQNRKPGAVAVFKPVVKEFKPIESNKEHLKRIAWSDPQVRLWCRTKQPITPEGLLQAGAYLAKYRDKHDVIVIPCGQNFLLFELRGHDLPVGKDNKGKMRYAKVKTVNKFPGWAQKIEQSDY